ncbi:MAG TPA: uracil-DNA glycosylase family protein [Pseudomonadales bacterium]|nr:uracil-DNA glycosylase family protein [Pseudomonadales bacterium]
MCAPVPAQGRVDARLLVVGLAPGAGGANRTGIPFLGDDSGVLLHAALCDHGFARPAAAGGVVLRDTRIVNAVRCVPPANRPTGAERARCRPFLRRDLGWLLRGGRRRRPVAVLALGRVAHESVLDALEFPRGAHAFGHGASHALAPGARLFDSYHPSRYNVNTGRLTRAMLDEVLASLRHHLVRRTRP